MREAALYNDYPGVNNYQCRFLKAYDGENDLHHNGTGEKGTSRWRVKGIGEHVNKPRYPHHRLGLDHLSRGPVRSARLH